MDPHNAAVRPPPAALTPLPMPRAGVHPAALGPLLDWAAAVVPSRQRAATPVFLFGTAGMRRLGLPRQAALLVQIRRILEGSGFRCVL